MNTTVAPTTTATQPNFHPLVEIFPEMDAAAFNEFVADVKANGVREPVTVYKNQIIDGKNRWRACQQLGIPCPQRAYEGKESDLLAFVVSKNLHRRQMSESQRAMVGARIANMRQGERTDLQPSATLPKVSQAEAGKQVGVSERSIRDAVKVIAKAAPEIVKAVEQNKLPVSAAAKVAEHPPEMQRQTVAAIAEGAKAAAVVRALPKAKSSASAPPKPSTKQWEAQDKADNLYASLACLADAWREDYGYEDDLWDYAPSEFWPLLDSERQGEVLRVAKALVPWLQQIVQQAEEPKLGRKPGAVVGKPKLVKSKGDRVM